MGGVRSVAACICGCTTIFFCSRSVLAIYIMNKAKNKTSPANVNYVRVALKVLCRYKSVGNVYVHHPVS